MAFINRLKANSYIFATIIVTNTVKDANTNAIIPTALHTVRIIACSLSCSEVTPS